jgi:hypothetical protein
MSRRVVSRVGVGVGVAVLLGVVAGAAARVLMRLLVVVAGEEGSFSVTGTLGILGGFVMLMVPGAVAAALEARRTARVLLVLGAGLLLFQSAVITTQEDRSAFLGADVLVQALLVVILVGFPAVIVAQAVVTGRVAAALGRRLGARPGRVPVGVG